jgi:protein-tyrosine phosphatase
MIDIHSHILAALDDGAASFEQSVEMVRMAAAAGTTDIVASPHANSEYEFDPAIVEAKIAELQAAVGESPRIHYGCDFRLNLENIDAALADPRKYAIGHRSYLLVEFDDYGIPPATSDIFAALIAVGMKPVITHPERNPILRSRMADLATWVAKGCAIQVTAQSLLGDFGKPAKNASLALLERGLVHVVASDGHDLKYRPPVLRPAHDFIAARYGSAAAHRLCVTNPQAVLDGSPVPPVSVSPKPRRWSPW